MGSTLQQGLLVLANNTKRREAEYCKLIERIHGVIIALMKAVKQTNDAERSTDVITINKVVAKHRAL